MCGITGFLGGEGFSQDNSCQLLLKNMNDALIHRGPDSEGVWFDKSKKIALGHRRLSIVDLSPAGHQPMISDSGRYVITYNGEIYNNDALRSELTANKFVHNWRGHSDTEVIVSGFDAWGIKETISRLTGMFAIAIWDKKLEKLILVRDRMGEKPLYFGWQGSGSSKVFLFGSELKALKQHPQFRGEIDRKSLSLYMRYSYVPTPHSIYKDIHKAEPGTIITVSPHEGDIKLEKYWDALSEVKKGVKNPFNEEPSKITNNLDKLLKKTINQQMMADVPLGAFLSGGIDSSAVVALMQTQSPRPIKTFTIGFQEAGYNEAKYAKLVAKNLGTDHTELYASSQDALNVIPKLPNLYCEPFADSSQIPTFLVSSLARQHVTVSLSGDGGDELFCGYNRYIYANKLWGGLKITPLALRSLVGNIMKNAPAAKWNKIFKSLNGITPENFNSISWGDKLQKGARVISSKDLPDLYQRLVSCWQNPSSVVIDQNEEQNIFSSGIQNLKNVDDIHKMMSIDSISYLPDDILVKVDRAAMGISLETRVPFLDHHVFEFASRIPLEMKLKNGVGKAVLREVLYKYVPKSLIERPKMGFGIPIGDWLRGPLRDWADGLLDESLLKSQGFFHSEVIREMWLEHINGSRNWQSQLWTVLMFQAWLKDSTSD
jgi:asparagine synthase (glutamine-hydrolysing)